MPATTGYIEHDDILLDALFDESLLDEDKEPEVLIPTEYKDEELPPGESIVIRPKASFPNHSIAVTYNLRRAGFNVEIEVFIQGEFAYTGIEPTEDRKSFIHKLKRWIAHKSRNRKDDMVEESISTLTKVLVNGGENNE